jgi:hypothetical protein
MKETKNAMVLHDLADHSVITFGLRAWIQDEDSNARQASTSHA